MKILVSACLLGINCKYNGGNNKKEILVEAFKKGVLIPVCPEQLGGLPTPRQPAKIKGKDGREVIEGKGKVLTVTPPFKDVTENFLRGARETLKIALMLEASACILKEKSPSCGVLKIYDFYSDNLKAGMGVTTALLKLNGFEVVSSDEEEKIKKLLSEWVG